MPAMPRRAGAVAWALFSAAVAMGAVLHPNAVPRVSDKPQVRIAGRDDGTVATFRALGPDGKATGHSQPVTVTAAARTNASGCYMSLRATIWSAAVNQAIASLQPGISAVSWLRADMQPLLGSCSAQAVVWCPRTVAAAFGWAPVAVGIPPPENDDDHVLHGLVPVASDESMFEAVRVEAPRLSSVQQALASRHRARFGGASPLGDLAPLLDAYMWGSAQMAPRWGQGRGAESSAAQQPSASSPSRRPKVCFWGTFSMNGVTTGWASIVRGWNELYARQQAGSASEQGVVVPIARVIAATFRDLAALELFRDAGAEVSDCGRATRTWVGPMHPESDVQESLRLHATLVGPELSEWWQSQFGVNGSTAHRRVHKSSLGPGIDELDMSAFGPNWPDGSAEAVLRNALRRLCTWNFHGRPWRMNQPVSPRADGEPGRMRLPLGASLWPGMGRDANLLRMCEQNHPWLEQYVGWLLRGQAMAATALAGCDVLVSTSDAGQDSAYFAVSASLAGVRASVVDAISVTRHTDNERRRMCDTAATALVSWSGLTRDLTATRCAVLGVPVCRAGSTVLGWSGPSARETASAMVSSGRPILGLDPGLFVGLAPDDLGSCDVPTRHNSVAMPAVILPVGIPPVPVLRNATARGLASPRRVGFVGRIASEKSVALAVLGVAAALRPSDPPTEMLIIGKGSLAWQLQNMVDRKQLFRPPHSFRMTGLLTGRQLAEAIASLDAMVFTSLRFESETFGLVPLEAMAAGVPVVAYGTGGSSDFIVNGSTAVVPAAPDAESLARAVRVALSREGERIAATAKAVADSALSEERAAVKWARFLGCLASCPEGGMEGFVALTEAGAASPALVAHRACARECAMHQSG